MLRVSPRQETLVPFHLYNWIWMEDHFFSTADISSWGDRSSGSSGKGPTLSCPLIPSSWSNEHFQLTSKLGKDNYEKVQLRSLLFPLGASCPQSTGPRQGQAPDALPRRAPRSKNLSAVKTSALISQTSQNPGSRKRRRVAFTWFPQIFQDVHEPEPKPLPHGSQAPT